MDHPTPETYQRYLDLLHDYGGNIRHYCIVHSDTLYEAQELAQEVMATLWRRMGTLADDSTPRQVNRWLHRVMRSTFLDHLRRHPRPRTVPLAAAEGYDDGQDYDAELLDALLQHLDADEHRLMDQYLAGYKAAEIAREHKISADAVRQRVHRIILKLRTIYKKNYE